jgi:hypothetical protein
MIEAHYVEIRTQKLPGQPATTVVREVHAKNGKARKSIKVLRGNRVISRVEEPLSAREKKNVQKRRLTRGLYNSAERKTRRRLSK